MKEGVIRIQVQCHRLTDDIFFLIIAGRKRCKQIRCGLPCRSETGTLARFFYLLYVFHFVNESSSLYYK